MRVLTIGTFEVLHMGHGYLFRQCERFGDHLTVGLNTDEFVEEYKGRRPIFDYEERRQAISALGYSVFPNRTAGRDLIEDVRPDVLVIGSDWATRDYYAQINVDQAYLDQKRITMVYVPRLPVLSSTEIRRRSK